LEVVISKPKKKPRFTRREITRINERIRAPQIRVIDSTNEAQLGVMTVAEGVRLARAKGLDLVEVAASANPPVCKIIDHGKWKYEQSKQKKGQKAKASKVKEIKFRINIETHDYEIKLSRAEEFLDQGSKLRVQLMFKGRQQAHPELGFQLMKRVEEDLKTMGHVDLPPRRAGKNISMMISPLPPSQRVMKFHHHKGKELLEEDEEDHDDEHHEGDHGDEEHHEDDHGTEATAAE
jgi:translation initiation factor IF-3